MVRADFPGLLFKYGMWNAEYGTKTNTTIKNALVVQRLRRCTCNAVTRVRVSPGALAIFDNQKTKSAHDVKAAYCLAMADVWVRFPLSALRFLFIICQGEAPVEPQLWD